MIATLARSIGVAIFCMVCLNAQANEGPVYQRHRTAAYSGYGMSHPNPGYYPFYPNFGYSQQQWSGYWFARPYPSHLDYHQVRSRMMPPVPACPCAEQQELPAVPLHE